MVDFPTTDNITEGLGEAERRRFDDVQDALDGLSAELALALLMMTICRLADQCEEPQAVWKLVRAGATAELKLINAGARLRRH